MISLSSKIIHLQSKSNFSCTLSQLNSLIIYNHTYSIFCSWDNLRKVLLVNTPINNAQGMSVLFAMICGMTYSPLTPIQVLYCNLICAVTLGFVTAVEPAEEGIMLSPPRKVGKRLIGRFLLLRIALGTATLVACTDGAAFWVQGLGYSQGQVRSQASNTLTLGAMMVMMSARFSYNSSLHPRLLHGNKFAWYSCFIVVALQLCITYVSNCNFTDGILTASSIFLDFLMIPLLLSN